MDRATPPTPATASAGEEWVEALVESVMAHKQSEDRFSWKACICCGRALNHLAPAIIARAKAEVLDEVEKMVEHTRINNRSADGHGGNTGWILFRHNILSRLASLRKSHEV